MADRARTTLAGRRSFAATVTAGLAGTGLAVVAAARPWATGTGDAAGAPVRVEVTGDDAAPLALALALVALAAWGVVLVARVRGRRAAAVVGLLAALGALGGVVAGFAAAQDIATDTAVDRGATGDALGAALTGWYWVCGGALLVAAAAFLVTLRAAPGWPEMSSRYDAPTTRPDADRPRNPWRALDEGDDPTL